MDFRHPQDMIIQPRWPLASSNALGAVCTTRLGGVSGHPYNSFNLGSHVGDDFSKVSINRSLLEEIIGITPVFPKQVHGVKVKVHGKNALWDSDEQADAVYSREHGCICAVLTADCLSILLAAEDSSEVAAVHAGWRGLAKGVISSTLEKFTSQPSAIFAYLGPAISQRVFEVGREVRELFVSADINIRFDHQAQSAFVPSTQVASKYYADLYQLATLELQTKGVTNVYGGEYCTFSDSNRFFSFRRDGETGRMASAIWLMPT